MLAQHQLIISHLVYLKIPQDVKLAAFFTGRVPGFDIIVISPEEEVQYKYRSPFHLDDYSSKIFQYLNLVDVLKLKPSHPDEYFSQRRNRFIDRVKSKLAQQHPNLSLIMKQDDLLMHTRRHQYAVYDVSIVDTNLFEPGLPPIWEGTQAVAEDFNPPTQQEVQESNEAFAAAEGTPPTPRKPSRHDCVGYVPRDK